MIHLWYLEYYSIVDKLYIVSSSLTSQYRNKKLMFLMKQLTKNNTKDVYWIFTEASHGKGPMDGVGACIKQSIMDTIVYNPNGIISNTEELMQYMSELSNICTLSYNFWRNHYTAKTTDAFFSILAQST